MAFKTKLVPTYYYKRAVFFNGCGVGHIHIAKKPMAFGIPGGKYYTFVPTVTDGHPLYTFGVTGPTVKAVLAALATRIPAEDKYNYAADDLAFDAASEDRIFGKR